MPILTPITVDASKVHVGDAFLTKTGVMNIAKVKVGHKWVTARSATGKLVFEVEIGTQVEVNREVLTEEEVAEKEAQREAEQLEYRGTQIEKWVKSQIDGYAPVVAKAAERLIAHPGDTYSCGAYDGLLQQGALTKMALELSALKENLEAHDGVDSSWNGTYERWVGTSTAKLLNHYSNRVLSRSSSVTNNLVEDAEREARSSVIHAGEYGGFYISI